MKLTTLLAVTATFLAAPLLAQTGSYPPTDFEGAGAPQPTDMTVVYRVGVAKARTMTMANIRNGISPLATTVQCFGVDDTATISAGITAALSNATGGGAVLHLSGQCLRFGSITNHPGSGLTRHLIIEGDGVTGTVLNFGSCDGDECILLAQDNASGSGHNDGSGLRNLTVVGLAGKDTVRIQGYEKFLVEKVYFYGGDTPLTIEECREGTVADSQFKMFAVDGIRIIGESHSDNSFRNLTIVGNPASPPSGSGIAYDKAGTTDAGGVYFNDIKVNGKFSGSGFRFTAVTLHSVFIFITATAADGDFANGSFKFVKTANVNLSDIFGVNQYAAANSAGLILDDVSDVTVAGGTFYSNTGASGADVFLSNSVAKTVMLGSRLTGPTLGIKVDGTTHDIDLRLSFLSAASLTNDATKLVPSSSARYAAPPFLMTGTTTSTMLGLLQPGSATAIYLRASSGGNLEVVANDGSTILGKITTTGASGAAVIPVADSDGKILGTFLPNPSASTLGGVQSKAAVANQFLTSISTGGVPASAQPAFTDISGSATDAQVPNDITIASTAAMSTTSTLSVGTASVGARATVSGADANNTIGSGSNAAVRIVNTDVGAAGRVSELQFGISASGKYSGISGALQDGTNNTGGDLIGWTRRVSTDTNPTEGWRLYQAGNFTLNGAVTGSSAVGVLAIKEGTAPSTAPVDTVQCWVAQTAAGDDNLYCRSEAGAAERITGLRVRNSSQFDVTSSTTLVNVTGLSFNVEAGAVYGFTAELPTVASVAGGVKFAIGGTATATAIWYKGELDNAGTITNARSSAMGTAVCAVTAATAADCSIAGVIRVNASGTLTVQFAQNASSGTASSVLVNGRFYLEPIAN